MNQNTTLLMEILKLVASFLTPVFILVLGLRINKSIERNKMTLLKEKEWQVRWAETFLIGALRVNENISIIVTSLSQLQQNLQKENKQEAKQKEDELLKIINGSIANIQYLNWDNQNFLQFAEKSRETVMEKQKKLLDAIKNIFEKKEGDLEQVRKFQFEYNKAVRKAHNEILNSNA